MLRRAPLLAALTLALAAPVAAQRDFSAVEIRTLPLRGPVHMLTGSGGNLAVSTGPQGVFLVDDQFAPLTAKIEAAIRKLRDEPVRFVLNTHFHRDHVGGNENLAGAGAVIVAHGNVRRRMSAEQVSRLFQRTTPPAPERALPLLTFESDVTFHLNGEDVHVFHVPAAHTDGDAVAHFRGSDVIHAGDVFFPSAFPLVDIESGGSVDGMIDALGRIFDAAGAETKIIPGHGALGDREGVRASREMLIGVRDLVRTALAEGESLEAFLARSPLADLEGDFGGGFLDAERFTRIVWADLSRRGTP